MPEQYQTDFAKRTNTKPSSGTMEEADTSNAGKTDESSSKSIGLDDQTVGRESSQNSNRRSDSSTGNSNFDSSITTKAAGTTEVAQPMMKMYFTEGTSVINSNNDVKGTNRLDLKNSKHSDGANSEVEQVGGGSNSGVKGKLVHELGSGQGQGQVQGQGQIYSSYNPIDYSYSSPTRYSTNKESNPFRYNLHPTVSYVASRYPLDSEWRAEQLARQRPTAYVNPRVYEEYRSSNNANNKPKVIVSSNLIEFPTALYSRKHSSELVNSNILRVH
jgi:hypothetical protein